MDKIAFQNSIAPMQHPSAGSAFAPGKSGKPEKSVKSFGEILKQSVNEVTQLQNAADLSIQKLAAGNEKDIHQTMVALEKAEISFQLVMQVRNKVIAAYDEIRRMQV